MATTMLVAKTLDVNKSSICEQKVYHNFSFHFSHFHMFLNYLCNLGACLHVNILNYRGRIGEKFMDV